MSLIDKTEIRYMVNQNLQKENKMEDTTKSSPEVHAERCPVCNGHTTVNYGRQTCKACNGKGYILVPNSLNEEGGEERNERFSAK